MTAIVDLSINDGQATPVSRTFAAMTSQQGQENPAVWYYKPTTQPIGWAVLTHNLRRTAQDSFRQKVTLKVPNLDTTIANAPKLAYTCIASVEFVMPAASTTQDRRDIISYVANFLSSQRNNMADLTPYI